MDAAVYLIVYLLVQYLTIGLTIVTLNLLISYLTHHSLDEAVYQEAIRSGLSTKTAQENNIFRNLIYVIAAWPVALWQTARNIFR